ncbi:MAG: hypothetical protein IH884_12460, partial [Myxococcales bacterium]|nr:hypothetical protein [Myxococcales bacterium]
RALLPQISKLPRPSKEQVETGIVLIAVGMFKKVMIGDAAGRFVDHIFAEPVRDVGYKWCFMTNSAVISSRTNPLQLQRANLESDDPPPIVRIQLSGLMDLMYAAKRRRVNRITAAPPSQVRSVEATGPGGGD